MEILSDVVNYLLSLGAAIFVPIIIIIAGLIVRMKLRMQYPQVLHSG